MENQHDMKPRCHTCHGRYWNVIHGKWIYTRETMGMVCPTCGRDFTKEDDDEKPR